MKIIGKNVAKERKKKNITQEMLAEGIGVSQAMISMLEKGSRQIRWSLIDAIATFIGCDPSTITEDKDRSPYDQVISNFKRLTESKQEIVARLIKELLK